MTLTVAITNTTRARRVLALPNVDHGPQRRITVEAGATERLTFDTTVEAQAHRLELLRRTLQRPSVAEAFTVEETESDPDALSA